MEPIIALGVLLMRILNECIEYKLKNIEGGIDKPSRASKAFSLRPFLLIATKRKILRKGLANFVN